MIQISDKEEENGQSSEQFIPWKEKSLPIESRENVDWRSKSLEPKIIEDTGDKKKE